MVGKRDEGKMKEPTRKEILAYQKKYKCTAIQARNWFMSNNQKHTITSRLIRAISSKPDEHVAEITYKDEGELGGYSSNDLTITIHKDGALFIADSDTASEKSIYLYPQQVKLLKRFLTTKGETS
jgi:methenyltetrahydromethanopterin cyclohydrolase